MAGMTDRTASTSDIYSNVSTGRWESITCRRNRDTYRDRVGWKRKFTVSREGQLGKIEWCHVEFRGDKCFFKLWSFDYMR